MTSDFERLLARGARRAAHACVLVAALLTGTPELRADSASAHTRSQARELALEGADAFERRDYPVALDRFQRAATLFPAPSILVMQARTLVRLGRLLEAVDAYEQTQRIPLAGDAPAAFRAAVHDAEREQAQVRARLARLEIRLHLAAGSRATPSVTLDGDPLPAALVGVPLALDPGRHVLRVAAAGHRPVQRDVTLAEGEQAGMEVTLEPVRPQGTPVSPSASARMNDGGSVLAWVMTSVGATALATSALTGVIAIGKKSDLDAVCKPGCPRGSEGDISAFRLNRTISYISLGVGAAALGAGGYLLLFNDSNTVQVGAKVGAMSASLVGRF